MKKGFTLIELLVVIAIIGILSSIVLAGIGQSRARARDVKRKMDLKQVQIAMELYFAKCDTYIVRQNCIGTAYGSGGWGWFNYSGYSGSAGAVAQGLVDNGVSSSVFIDPSGQISSNGVRTGYMVGAGTNYYTLWANLENPSTADTNTLNNCLSSGYDSYHSSYTPSARTNYCVSN
ncbi:MAG: hypothetical protein A2431_02875 [Candidatus Zambryskibacteria bacterium RIFOXYC1_FULL_39_10]|uniref:Type II secretion system protein GspG C-terminal domain-containing protein n=1 Tax=Candidatus Zambryskibacteria bacterium RIFOXYC1_FULL_39_10 TaxID=1802779 RepID=A0A1G2V013_9BACT|nr:MAG: hypothetical protein A2605_02195 [Candidatus Zambryskibacteria bacterium RIFOXYD1_FULL_39_35]OHB14966.1 MAG: hypothetical protein A2431_02875 [Candidatus Zambryskibacteria bacterium RIFOXYC1_FULL_39_10]